MSERKTVLPWQIASIDRGPVDYPYTDDVRTFAPHFAEARLFVAELSGEVERNKGLRQLHQRALILFAERFWQAFDVSSLPRTEHFARSRGVRSSNPLGAAVCAIGLAIDPILNRIYLDLSRDPETQVLTLASDRFCRAMNLMGLTSASDIGEHFFRELIASANILSKLVEVLGATFELKHGRFPSEEEYLEEVDKAGFQKIALAMGLSGVGAEVAFCEVVEIGEVVGGIRLVHYDPAAFELDPFRIKPEKMEQIHAIFSSKNIGKKTCPAAYVKDEKGIVLTQYAEWVLGVLKREYIPVICAEGA